MKDKFLKLITRDKAQEDISLKKKTINIIYLKANLKMVNYQDMQDVFTGMVVFMKDFAIMMTEMEKVKIIIMMAVTMKVIIRIILKMVKELSLVKMEIF